MKILKATNVNLIQGTLKKSVLPVLMLSTFIPCIANTNNKDSFEHSKNSTKPTVETNISKEIETQESTKTTRIDLKEVKMTNGLIKNRNPLEIQKITRLSPKEFEVLNKEAEKIINEHYAKELGKLNFAGTKCVDRIFDNDDLEIVYTNGKENKVFTWNKKAGRFEHYFDWYTNAGLILEVQKGKDGDFWLKRTVNFDSEKLHFTKDGVLVH